MKTTRIAFFADLHIRGDELHSQTDFGAPTRIVPRKAREALNDIAPDYIFGLGDLTAESAPEDWRGYQRWLEGIDAPVFDIFGNHDRDYTVFVTHSYGEEYYSVLGRVADTKALRIGNTIFVLISEEHNPEGNPSPLTSTVPDKRFQFLESILKEYSSDHNIFVLSHTLLRSTTALSDQWSFNDTRMWTDVTKKFFRLFDQYPVVGHLTGHTHIDYRYRAHVRNLDGTRRKRKVGKFVDGRAYDSLPTTTFLNMPCVDTAHGWVGSNFAFMRTLGKSTAKAKKSPVRKIYMSLEERGPRLFDTLYRSRINDVLGRGAVYYVDLIPGQGYLAVTTRWLRKNRDVERYPVHLKHRVELGDGTLQLLASDLSICTKDNLSIPQDDWFLVPAGQRGTATFSQSFPSPVSIQGLAVQATGPTDYSVRWKGSRNGGNAWSAQWETDPRALGRVDAVMIELDLQAGEEDAPVTNV
ncbi:MAG: metallophosphoesterase family protein, partial [Chloroflexota bacterium]